MNERFAFDLDTGGRALVAGADEAGRGCLAGPLVAAAVSFDYAAFADDDFEALARLDDSKRLSGAQRTALYGPIIRRARDVVVVSCSAASIDHRGLHRCNLDCLAAALERVEPAPVLSLVDGFPLRSCRRAHRAVRGGDGRSAVIAAASVVAKVTRDRVMRRLHERFPAYGFDRHVGYATAAHRAAIEEHGVCAVHRRSFASVAYRQLDLSFAGEQDGEALPGR